LNEKIGTGDQLARRSVFYVVMSGRVWSVVLTLFLFFKFEDHSGHSYQENVSTSRPPQYIHRPT